MGIHSALQHWPCDSWLTCLISIQRIRRTNVGVVDARVVYVGMVGGVGVRVVVYRAVGVYVEVAVRLVADGPLHAPDSVSQPEPEHQPGGDVASGGFEGVQPADRHADSDADRSQNERTEHVAHTAGQRDGQRSGWIGESPRFGSWRRWPRETRPSRTANVGVRSWFWARPTSSWG